MMQLTKDHSLLRQLIDMGQVSEQRAQEFMYKNIITRAIGTESSVEPSVHVTHVEVGDVYMMCTDGLSDLLSTKEMEDVILKADSLESAAAHLVARANEIGGHDNITVVIAKVLPSEQAK
jgi:protein phosphatase